MECEAAGCCWDEDVSIITAPLIWADLGEGWGGGGGGFSPFLCECCVSMGKETKTSL